MLETAGCFHDQSDVQEHALEETSLVWRMEQNFATEVACTWTTVRLGDYARDCCGDHGWTARTSGMGDQVVGVHTDEVEVLAVPSTAADCVAVS